MPTRQELLTRGLSEAQADHYIASRQAAINRRTWRKAWNKAMPPQVRQSFGILGQPSSGIRIPLLDVGAVIPCLPALMPCNNWPSVELNWLRECHQHPRDVRIVFQDSGHLYFVDGKVVELSVTGLLGQYSEARCCGGDFWARSRNKCFGSCSNESGCFGH